MEDVYSFGAWMRHRRKGLRLTQAELASSVGVATVTIHKIESDERRPSLQVATLLAEHLQLPPGLRDAFLLAARGGCLPDRLPDIAPAVKPSAVPGEAPGYLPVRVTSFVGREQEIRTLNAQLQSGDIRLITLVGAGGSGKTSLALQVSSRLAEYFPGGVWFVDLSAVTDPAQVAVTMTQALGIPQRSDITPHAQIMLRLRMARALVLLDNCEHLLEAVAMLAADLMRAAPGVTLLATSRAPLRVQGEHEIVVVPLAFPDSQYLPELDALAEYDALRLFCERARAVQASFQLCAANMLTVAEICARLDGMPLAIELAVAWLRVFTPQELLVRLENAGLDVLTSGVRDLPERHRTVRATIVWSEQLLGPHEQTLLARLGVFAGSWTLEAAEVVCADEEVEVVSCLDTLLQHSLVQRQDAHSGSRFTLLDTVRTFARERLATSGDERRLRERYACYYVTLAESTLRNAIDPPDRSGIDVLDHELENMRAVLRWAVAAHEKLPIELGLRLMVATHLYWEIHAGRPEGHQWFQRLFVHAEQVEPRLRLAATLAMTELHKFFDAAGAWAMLESIEQPIAHSGDRQLQLVFHSYAGWSELFLHRREAAIARWKAALQQLDAQDGMCWQAEFHWGIGFACYFLRRLEQSERHLRASLRLSQAYNNLYVASENLHWMALTLAERGCMAKARELLNESISIARRAGSWRTVVQGLELLSDLLLAQSEYKPAEALISDALELTRQQGNRPSLQRLIYRLARLRLAEGKPEVALALLDEVRDTDSEPLGFSWLPALLLLLGKIDVACGYAAMARSRYRASLIAYQEKKNIYGLALVLEALAALEQHERRELNAARCRGAAAGLREAIAPLSWHPMDRYAFETPSSQQFHHPDQKAAWLAGYALTPGQAVEEALVWLG